MSQKKKGSIPNSIVSAPRMAIPAFSCHVMSRGSWSRVSGSDPWWGSLDSNIVRCMDAR